jgi:hypothetical protein
MNNKNLVALALIAVITSTIAVIQYRSAHQPVQTGSVERSYLIQGMDTSNIVAVRISEGENKQLELRKKGDGFVVSQRDGYPADTERINRLITNLLDIKTQEKVTDNPENFSELEIGYQASQIRFYNSSDKVIAGVCIGRRNPEVGGIYVRLADSNNVFLAESAPRISTDPKQFIDKELLSLNTKKITEITVEDANGTYTITSEPNSTAARLEGIPEGKQAKGTKYRQVFSALNRLTVADVVKDAKTPVGLDFDHKYVCKLSDQRIYTLRLAKKGERYFLKCKGEYTGPENITKQRRKESKEELKKKEELLLAKQAIQEFNDKSSGWVYTLPGYKARNLVKDFSQLIEDIGESDKDKKAPAPGKKSAIPQDKPLGTK